MSKFLAFSAILFLGVGGLFAMEEAKDEKTVFHSTLIVSMNPRATSAVESTLFISFPLPKPEGSGFEFASNPRTAIKIHSILADGVRLIPFPNSRGVGGVVGRTPGVSLRVYTFMADKEQSRRQNRESSDAIEHFYFLPSIAGLFYIPLDVNTLEITYSGMFHKFADENSNIYTSHVDTTVYTLIATRDE